MRSLIKFLFPLYLFFLSACGAPSPDSKGKKVDMIISGVTVMTMDKERRIIENGLIAISNGEIVEVGERAIIDGKYATDNKIDGAGKLILPGLINTHTHVPMTLFRGMADDLPLATWLQEHIWPAEARFINQESVHIGALLAIAEMLRSGITTFNDMYFFEDEVASAASQAGIRAYVGEGLIDFPSPNSKTPEEAIAYTEMLMEKWGNDPLVKVTVAPHSPYASSQELLEKANALADKYKAMIHIHVSETEKEVNDMKKAQGISPVQYLDKIGFLGNNVMAAHCVHLSENDMNLMVEKGVGIAHNPQSNMKLASGIAPIPQLVEKGAKLSLGTDGAASNNDLNLWEEINSAAMLHKVATGDPTVMNAKTVMEMATIGGAKVLGAENEIGSLEEGKKADIILVDLQQAHLAPIYDYYSHAAYSVDGSDVTDVIIEGKRVMENRKLLNIDEAEILADAKRLADQIMGK